MKLRRFATLSSVFVCFSTTAPAFAATWVVDNDFADCPQAEFNSIQAAVLDLRVEPGDRILVCPGDYTETPPPSPAAVLINKNDLRIEAQAAPGEVVLQGTAAQEFGFLLNTTGVVLQGFTVTGFNRGNIRIQEGSGNTVRMNVTTASVAHDGIQVINSSANIIEHNTSFGNRQDGIFLQGSSGNIIRHNETHNNRQMGINLFLNNLDPPAPGNVLFGNRSHDNSVRGISLEQSGQTVIEHNHVFANGLTPIPGVLGVGNGIGVRNSNGVTVRNNQSENNGAMGIALNAASNNVVSNNRSESNRMAGIVVTMGASNNLVETNIFFLNSNDGILVTNNADNNIVQLNHARENGRDGIRIGDAASNGNTIERNVLLQNVEHDAHDNSAPEANFWTDNRCGAEDHPGQNENRPGLCEHPGH